MRPAGERVVAVVCSDVHLSDKPPTARLEQTTEEWRAAMKHVLEELRFVCDLKDGRTLKGKQLPLIVAGDLFDQPKPSPGLINFAWRHLPNTVYAVAGQHDLPNHSMAELEESGLGVLCASGRVELLDSEVIEDVVFVGTSWDECVRSCVENKKVSVAIIHEYCWKEGHSFPGAPTHQHVQAMANVLVSRGYKGAITGDNHLGFAYTRPDGDFSLVNNGIVIPRNADFADYVPHYTLVYSDGTLKRVPFNTRPQWQPWVFNGEETKKASKKLLDFAQDVASLVGKDTKENFLDELQEEMRKLDDGAVRQKVWDIIQSAQEKLR